MTSIPQLAAHRPRPSPPPGRRGPLVDGDGTPMTSAERREPIEVEAVELPAEMASAGVARRFASDVLLAWGRPKGAVDDAMLVVSELVTNSVQHARSACRVELWLDGGRVRGSVSDASVDMPMMRPIDPSRVGGNGLRVIASVTDELDVRATDTGKTITFTLR
jgi:anti-sigma regulatory factor (Ser/Thr protein kinase)